MPRFWAPGRARTSAGRGGKQIGSYAPNGNILSLTDSVIGPWSYTYDTLNRLASATAGAGNVPYPGETGCWQYDAFGNRTLEAYSTVTSAPCASGANDNTQLTTTPQSSAYNNRLSTVTYDLSGDAINDGRNSYLYDGEGRICAVASPNGSGGSYYEQYVYDASGTRVAKGMLSAAPTSCAAPTAADGFTLKSHVYDPAKQIRVMIQENGKTIGYEHLFNNDLGVGPLYINGSTHLTP